MYHIINRGNRRQPLFRCETDYADFLSIMEDMLRKFCVLSDDGHAFLEQAAGRYGLSARAVNRVLRLSRTVADVWAHDVIDASDIRTALSLRDADL